MGFPNFDGKHAEQSFLSPHDYLEYLAGEGLLPHESVPEAVILCYQPGYYRRLVERYSAESVGGAFRSLCRMRQKPAVGVMGGFGIGAPVAATVLEELVPLGVRRVISIGTAGGLAPGCNVGDVVICDGAIRDEGTSYHYLPPSKYVSPSVALTAALRNAADAAGLDYTVGHSWTVDAPYRETVAGARNYQAEGVLTVEMEASALFAVAEVRGVDIASAFVVSDSLAELTWQPRFHAPETEEAFHRLADVAYATLAEVPGGSIA